MRQSFCSYQPRISRKTRIETKPKDIKRYKKIIISHAYPEKQGLKPKERQSKMEGKNEISHAYPEKQGLKLSHCSKRPVSSVISHAYPEKQGLKHKKLSRQLDNTNDQPRISRKTRIETAGIGGELGCRFQSATHIQKNKD